MINSKDELFKWGPIDGKILYVSSFPDKSIFFQKKLGISWPDFIEHVRDDKVIIIIGNKILKEHGKIIFENYIMNRAQCKKYYDIWFETAKEAERLCLKYKNLDLADYSDKKLLEELKKLEKEYTNFWCYGFIPELANWGGEAILREEITRKYINHVNDILEVLTAPEELSFYQVEERDLLNIRSDNEFKKHEDKYFWIKNSYGGVTFVTADNFKENYSKISKEEASEKLKKIKSFTTEVKKRKLELQKKFNIPEELMKIASRLSFSIWWQDLRKKYIFMMLHVIDHFVKEIAKRNNLTLHEIEQYTPSELLALAENKTKVNLSERKLGHLAYYNEKGNSVSYEYGKKADETVKKYIEINVSKDVKEIKGVVTSKGKVRGRVRILAGARHFDSMQEGEVLVAAMTSPEFIVAMRKAVAIVTDEGGLTCHAAIVSRELGIPCIVATKIATRTLKTGDLVEVDAIKGIITILERAK